VEAVGPKVGLRRKGGGEKNIFTFKLCKEITVRGNHEEAMKGKGDGKKRRKDRLKRKIGTNRST